MEEQPLERVPDKKLDARVVRTYQKVLDATAALILEKGAVNFTVEALVERTGVALTTIYRHWRTRNELLADGIAHLSDPIACPDNGSTREDLVSFFTGRMDLRHWDEKLRTLPGIIEAGRTDSKIAVVVTQFVAGLHKTIQIMLVRGQRRGEVRRDLELAVMADVLLGAIILRRGYRGEKMSEAQVTTLLDTIMEGIAVCAPAGTVNRPVA